MKTKKIFAVVLATLIASCLHAQELKKAVLGVEQFTYSSSFSRADVEMVRNQIVAAVNRTGRVIVVDHNSSTDDALDQESERRKQESAMDANNVKDMVSLNANSLMSVHLDQLSITKETYVEYEYVKVGDKTEKRIKGKYPYIHAKMTYTVKITDCETGAVQAQESYTVGVGGYNTIDRKPDFVDYDSAHDAIVHHCVNQDKFSVLILNTFKAQGKILQVDEGDAKKAKSVYISLGSEDGIAVKQTLEVYREIDIAGEKSRKFIGEVEVIEIMGASRCRAKVKKGGDLIQQALSAGNNVPVQSRNVVEKFFGGVK